MKESFAQRTKGREQAFIIMFQKFFNEDYTVDKIIKLAESADSVEIEDYAKKLAETSFEHISDIDEKIEPNLKSWTLSRLPKVVFAVLRIAVCEIMYFDDVPVAVTINEFVELMKKYGDKQETSFVNGILGSVARSIESV